MKFSMVVIAASAVLATSGPALAHAKLVSSNPAAKAAVTAPKTISLTFSDKVVPAFSTFEVVMKDHKMKVPVKTSVSKDGKTISGVPAAKMMPGRYSIIWTIASSDGHRMGGEVLFQVR